MEATPRTSGSACAHSCERSFPGGSSSTWEVGATPVPRRLLGESFSQDGEAGGEASFFRYLSRPFFLLLFLFVCRGIHLRQAPSSTVLIFCHLG